jgi:hypothetical protein
MSSAGFKFGEMEEGKTPKTVEKVAKVEPYIVAYTDGEGKSQARMAFRIPGADTTYMLQERVSGNKIVLPAHSWFHKGFVEKLVEEGFEEDKSANAVESV